MGKDYVTQQRTGGAASAGPDFSVPGQCPATTCILDIISVA